MQTEKSYFEDTIEEFNPKRPSLKENADADVCVVGGGSAGLSVALSLIERGKSVIVVDKDKIGDGASGRNAGMVCSGFQCDPMTLAETVGFKVGRMLIGWASDAQKLISNRIDKYNIKCDKDMNGLLTLSCFKDQDAEEYTKELNEKLDAGLEVWGLDKIKNMYKTNYYYSGIFEPDSFTVHPLNYTLGLARACEQFKNKFSQGNGGVCSIYENTKALCYKKLRHDISDKKTRKWVVAVESDDGNGSVNNITCDAVVMANSWNLEKNLNGKLLPKSTALGYTYIMVTEPLEPELLNKTIEGDHPVCDDRFVLSYYRKLKDNRLLWGGLFTAYDLKSREKKENCLRTDMVAPYPLLKDVKVDYVWGGKLACGLSEMPLIGQLSEKGIIINPKVFPNQWEQGGVWFATGFGGHGLVPTALCGELIASAITDIHDERWKVLSSSFSPHYLGWPFTSVGLAAFIKMNQLYEKFVMWKQL